LAKETKNYPRGKYNAFPAFHLNKEKINSGFTNLALLIRRKINSGLRTLMIDGFQGVDWNEFRRQFSQALSEKNIFPEWLDMHDCLDEPGNIFKRAEPFLGGDDRLFGTHYPFGAELFFNARKMAEYRIRAAIKRGTKAGELTVFLGQGAGLLELWDELWYVDFPKDKAQILAREGKISNLGETQAKPFEEFYKRSYFVEWPALNRLKRRLLPEINLLIDGQNPKKPTFISGRDFRAALHQLSQSPFRVRPWFFPGPWGGKFMQGHMGLDSDLPNIAWSFELIVPENGIVLEHNNSKLECSFDFLMFQENRRVLGKNAAGQFKYEWPIRFDYLDTVDGGNLSTQVHPRPDYIRKNFGETYTQDESYYIVVAKPDARVYLGLRNDCNPKEFRNALEESVSREKEVDIGKFVNYEPSNPHDLFLIPNGTVHCSGAGNLVLEISATPYIFTFKIYDYLRRDLNGNLRPINIEHGFANIRFERKKDWVQKNLLAKPKLIGKGRDWKVYLLYDKPFTFYKILRIEFETEYEVQTTDRAFVVNLVQGDQAEVVAQNGRAAVLSYLETLLIPAAANKVTFVNKGRCLCKMVLVFIKPGIGVSIPLNTPQDG